MGLQSLLELTLLNAYFYPIPDFTAAVASPRGLPPAVSRSSFSTPRLGPKGCALDVPKPLPQLPPSDQLPLQLLTAPITLLHLPQLPSQYFTSHRKATSGGRELCLSTVGPPGAEQKVFNNGAVEVVCEWNPSDLSGTVAQTRPHLLFPFWMAPDNCQLSPLGTFQLFPTECGCS